jgi:hypothetical protein
VSLLPTRALPRPRWRIVGFIVLMVPLAAAGALMVHEGQPLGWLIGGFFALCAATFVWMLVGDFGVTLDHDGFEIRTLFTRKRYRWAHVSTFAPYRTQSSAMVLFDDADRPEGMLTSINRAIVGKTESIPAILLAGSVEDASVLMNQYRATARIGFAIVSLLLERWLRTRTKREQTLIPIMLIVAVPIGFLLFSALTVLPYDGLLGASAPVLLATPFLGLMWLLVRSLRMKRDMIVEIGEKGFTMITPVSKHFEPWAKVSPFTVLGDLEIRYEIVGGGDGFFDKVMAQRSIPNTAADEGDLPALCAALNRARENAWARAA